VVWEAAQLGAQIGAVGDDVYGAAARVGGDRLDELAGDDGLGRPPFAPQPGQHRECNRPVQERQGDHDRGDDEGVAAGEFRVAFGHFRGAVVDPVRGIDPTAGTSEERVVDGDQERRADRQQMADDHAQHN
jgi:hypothetical protein